MEKKLPLNLDIPYNGMCRDMNRLVAIMASNKNIPWYINNFIPQVMYDTGNIHCYDTNYSYQIFDIYDQVAEFQFIKIKDSTLSILVEILDNNEYVLLNCDKYYIETFDEYINSHVYQEILIYGYNSEKQNFYFFSHLNNSKGYGVGEIGFTDLYSAIKESLMKVNEQEALNWQYGFGHPFTKFKVKDHDNRINLRKMFYLFYTQLYSHETMYTFLDNTKKVYYNGISIFDGLNKLIQSVENSKFDYSVQDTTIWSIKLLAEHTKSHEIRFNYLFKHNIISENKEIVSIIDGTSKQITILYNTLKKYLLLHKEKDIKKCYGMLEAIKENYINMLTLAITIIQDEIEKYIR